MRLVPLAAMLTAFATPAAAQAPDARFGIAAGEAVIYRDRGFSGPAVNVSRAAADLQLAWPVTSIRVMSGVWELCPRPNYRGACITVDRNERNLRGRLPGNVLASMRPVASGGGGGGGSMTPDESLRGMAAEFFTAPREGGRRVLACATGSGTANCAKATADRFCQARGWTRAARTGMQTESRRVYLADVLCSTTGY